MNSAASRAQPAGPEKIGGVAILLREKGVILVAVLWICALIMWLALQIGAETRLQGEEQLHVTRKSQALYLAIGGCFEALARMGQMPSLDAEAPPDLNWLPDGLPRIVSYDTGVAVVVVQPEDEKVNVNKAQPDQLKAVFERAGIEEPRSINLADMVADFIDRDDIPRLHGAERNQYKKWGLPGPFDGPLSSLDQLLLIPGITHQLYYGYVRGSGSESPERVEIFKDLLIPSQDSLFSLCTIYGNTTKLQQAPAEIAEQAPKPLAWRPGRIYRVLSFGKSFNGPPAVCYWMVVKLAAAGRIPYTVLCRKVL